MTKHHPPLLSFLLATATLASACSSSSSESTAVLPPPGPPAFAIVSPLDGECAVLWNDETWVLRTTVSITNWLMRPPGFCGLLPQCGHAVVFVDDVRVASASSLAIDVPMASGDHNLRIELRTDEDAVAMDGNERLLAAEANVHALAPGLSCSAGIDGGIDAPVETGSDADSDIDVAAEGDSTVD